MSTLGGTRAGFTLMELIMVIMILSIVAALTAPTMMQIASEPAAPAGSGQLRTLLRSARALAIAKVVRVSLVLDPPSGRYRLDTLGAGGQGLYLEGTLEPETGVTLESDSARVHFSFEPEGSAFGDSVIVHADGQTVLVKVDPLNGEFRAYVP